MSRNDLTRREVIKRGVWAGAAAGLASAGLQPRAQARVIGANDRINLGLIGCGGRGRYIMRNMAKPADANINLVAVCDIHKSRLAEYVNEATELFGTQPRTYADYHELLADGQVDAVIIATPDHQHCGQTIDAVQAGKHVYVEKPLTAIPSDLPELNRCYDVVKASKMVVQNGTHGVSCPAAVALKELVAGGKLGKLFRVESTETAHVPYWVHYRGPQSETDTDWKAFLYNREPRPFDAHLHACWMGYFGFTSGTIGGWMSHFINTLHFITGCDYPVSATAWGGRYASTNDPRCDAPDQVAVLLDYAEGFHTQFTSHFGSGIDGEKTLFMFEKGSVRCRFGHHLGNPVVSSEGVDESIKPYTLLEADPPYPGAAHVKNWLDCVRGGGRPNADIEFGHKHGIAVLAGDLACRLGHEVIFDRQKRELRPA